MVWFKKIASFINGSLVIFSLIVFVTCCFFITKTASNLRIMILLPLFYFACLMFSSILYYLRKINIYLVLIHSFFIVQYLIIPLLIFIDGNYNWTNYNPEIGEHILEATLLQIFVLLFLTFLFALQKNDSYAPRYFSVEYDKEQTKHTNRLILILLLASLLLIVVYPQLLSKFRLISFSKIEDYYSYLRSSEAVKNSMPVLVYEFGLLLLKIVKLLLSYFLVVQVKRTVGQKHPFLGIVLSLLIIGLLCLITTEDKAASVFSGIVSLLLLAKMYVKESKRIIKISVILMTSLVAVVFVAPMIVSPKSMNLSYSLNAYFSGTINVSGGFLMNDDNKMSMLMGDIFRSIPYVNHFFLDLPMSYIEFNRAIGYDTVYNSEIIPIISQGHFYFGIVGAVFLPFLLLFLAKKALKKMLNSSSSFEFYAYSSLFLYLFLGVFLYDFALVISQVINYCLPIMIVYIFTKRRKQYNEESVAILKRKQCSS